MNTARLRQPAVIVALTVLGIGAVGMGSAIRLARIYLDKLPVHPESGLTLLALPTETKHWKQFGHDQVETEEVEEVLGTTNYLNRTYLEKNPPQGVQPRAVDFHAAYYTDQIDTVPHVPDRCFVGGGMQIGSAPVFLPLNLDRSSWQTAQDVPEEWRGRVFSVRTSSDFGNGRGQRVRLPRDPAAIEMKTMEFIHPGSERRIYAGYFFIANGGTVARAEGVRLLAFNLTDDYAYYLKVQFTSERVQSAEELRDLATDLLNDLLPEIMICLPDWTKVQTGQWPPDNPRRKTAPPAAPQGASGDRR